MELCHCPCVGGFQCLRSVIRNAIILKAGGFILWKYYHRELIMRTYMTLTTYRSIHPQRKSLIVQCDVRWWNKGRENLKKSLMIMIIIALFIWFGSPSSKWKVFVLQSKTVLMIAKRSFDTTQLENDST